MTERFFERTGRTLRLFFCKNEPISYMMALIIRCTEKMRREEVLKEEVLKEEILVAQLKEGSKEAFDELYEKYKNMAIHTAYLITGNPADSEDITQETFVKVWLHIRELKNDSGFKPWMMQILVRTAYRVGRKRKREIPDEEAIERTENRTNPSLLDKAIQLEEAEMITAAVKALPIKLKTVVVLYYYDSLTVKEIAGMLGVMEGTVKSRLHTARRRLQLNLKEKIE